MVKSIFYQTYLKAFENSFSIQVLNIKLTNEHKIFDNGITFIEDLMNLGEITNNTTQICAVPLKMDCLDGAPMRTVAIDWF